MKYLKTYKQLNEGLRDMMKSKSDEDILDDLKKLPIFKWLVKIKEYNLDEKFYPPDEEIRKYLDSIHPNSVIDLVKELNLKEDILTKEEIKKFSTQKLEHLNYFYNNNFNLDFLKDDDGFIAIDLFDYGLLGTIDSYVINNIPDNIRIKNSIYLEDRTIYTLPTNMIIDGDLHISSGNLEKLPNKLIVKGNFNCSSNKITELPENLNVGGWFSCSSNKIKKIPKGLVVGDSFDCSNNELEEISDDIKIDGQYFDCSNNKLKKLPDNLHIKGGNLDCSNNELEELPKNLRVGWWLDCRNNKITELPICLVVKNELNLKGNPISKDIKIPEGVDKNNVIF